MSNRTLPVDITGQVSVLARVTWRRGSNTLVRETRRDTIFADLPAPAALAADQWGFDEPVISPRNDEFADTRYAVVFSVPTWVEFLRWNNQNPGLGVVGVATTKIGAGLFRMDSIASPIGSSIANLQIRVGIVEDKMSPWSDYAGRKTSPVIEGEEDDTPPPPPPPPPPPEQEAPVTSRSSVTLSALAGFTTTAAREMGQYADGSWFVYNPAGGPGVAFNSVTPNSVNRATGDQSGRRMHGLMRDPIINRTSYQDRSDQGFDAAGSGNWMGRHTRYNEGLNVNPNLKGNIVFAPGEEGCLYKAVSEIDPTNASRSCYREFHIITVVKQKPAAGAFRPSPDRDVKSKASIANVSQLDAVTHPIVTLAKLPPFSIAQTKRYLTGPFMSPALGARPNTSLYGRLQTFDKNDPLYSAVFGQAVNAAHCYIMDSRTSPADRLDLLVKMCQIGLDLMQAGANFDRFEYAPTHNFQSFVALIELAAVCLDNPQVRAVHAQCVANDIFHEKQLRQGNNPNVNGGVPGTSGKTSLRIIDASDIFWRTPPEGLQAPDNMNKPIQTPFIGNQEFGQTPYSGGHIGYPFGTGSGTPNGGYHSNINMSYRRLSWVTVCAMASVACYNSPARTGVSVINDLTCFVNDRHARYMAGHFGNQWSLEGTPQFVNKNWTIWEESWLDLYNKTRSSYAAAAPVWLGPPEQPFPPLVSKPGAGQLRMQFLSVRVSNDGPLTGAQYRIRRVKTSNVSGSWQQNPELRQLVFYNNAPWNAPVDVATNVGTITLSGLAGGIWQVQWRLRNGNAMHGGWGPWSTNCGYAGDERAGSGWPVGPRGVILL